MGIES
jgi:hypothetical protein